jgi:hypothetical protein
VIDVSFIYGVQNTQNYTESGGKWWF